VKDTNKSLATNYKYNETIKDKDTKKQLELLFAKHSSSLNDIKDIDITPSFNILRQSDLWYRGHVASIATELFTFRVDAVGDQRYSLYVNDIDTLFKLFWDEIVVGHGGPGFFGECFKQGRPFDSFSSKNFDDKVNFHSSFGYLLKTDEDLKKYVSYALGVMEDKDKCLFLECGNNNWLEISAVNNISGKTTHLTDIMGGGLDVGDNVIDEIMYIIDSVQELNELCISLNTPRNVDR